MEDNYYFVKNFEDAKLYDLMPPISTKLLSYLFENIINKDDILVDIGCGTGRLSKELLENDNIVYGVEPDENMISVCNENLKLNRNFHLIKGSDINTGLSDNSVNCVLVSQSLHRFNTPLFRKECNRVLKDNGNICVMWNRVHFGKPVFKELLNALKSVYPNYKSRYGTIDEVSGCIDEMNDNLLDARNLIGRNMKSKFFKNDYVIDHSQFRSLVLSLGLFPIDDNSNNKYLLENEIDKETFIKKIDKIFFKYAVNDKITLPFESDLHYMN